eukprot:1144448-Prorocentrum_minimum.AAC.2
MPSDRMTRRRSAVPAALAAPRSASLGFARRPSDRIGQHQRTVPRRAPGPPSHLAVSLLSVEGLRLRLRPLKRLPKNPTD